MVVNLPEECAISLFLTNRDTNHVRRANSSMENPMEALKQIPQAFFEFFARLVPGFVAFGLWLGLFGGADHWQNVLGMVMVGR